MYLKDGILDGYFSRKPWDSFPASYSLPDIDHSVSCDLLP